MARRYSGDDSKFFRREILHKISGMNSLGVWHALWIYFGYYIVSLLIRYHLRTSNSRILSSFPRLHSISMPGVFRIQVYALIVAKQLCAFAVQNCEILVGFHDRLLTLRRKSLLAFAFSHLHSSRSRTFLVVSKFPMFSIHCTAV